MLFIPLVNDTMFCSVHLKYKYPVETDEEERTRWKAVLTKLNAKCRAFRRPPPPRSRRAGSTSSTISSEDGSVSGHGVNNPAATPDHNMSLEGAEQPDHTTLQDAEHY